MAAWVVASLLLLADLRGDLQQIVVRSGVEAERVGIAVGTVDAPPLYRHGAGVARIPASNQKLLTAAAAILKLGADFEFATRVGLTPEGHLVVVGDGDPNFSGRWFDGDPNVVLKRFARDVARRGVTEIKGDLVLDAAVDRYRIALSDIDIEASEDAVRELLDALEQFGGVGSSREWAFELTSP